MTLNTADGFVVNYKVEVTEGTAAAGGAATGERLRVLASPGLKATRGTIQSAEIRDDANAGAMRLGSQMADGSYAMELSQGSFDTAIEAVMRSTWVAPVAVTFNNSAGLTSLQVTAANTIAWVGTTTPVAAGLRVGDTFRLTDMSTAANNSVNCTVSAISGGTITITRSVLTIQAADNACTLTIHKKIAQATTPVRRTFTVEQYYEDIDQTELFTGCRFTSMQLSLTPNGMVTMTAGLMGLGRQSLATGASPYFTSPTTYSSIALVATDAALIYNGVAIATITGMTLDLAISTQGAEVVGSVVMPGTFDNRMTASGSISMLLDDLTNNTLFDAETEFQIHIALVEPESEPKSHVSFYLPAVKITDISKALGGDGPMAHDLAINLQPRVAATGFDAGIMTISTAA